MISFPVASKKIKYLKINLLKKIKFTSLVAQTVKRLPTMWETWVQSLGQEDPLEKGLATHSSILALENPMDRRSWWAIVHGVTKSQSRLSN